ncbi:MAG: TSUP family transporter [Candidatus Cloacimonetes bacterium]|nr:TSUP family transporter [Candidatus Cloacimonadota bacterium]
MPADFNLLRAYIIVLPLIFVAGLVDSVSGGGGLISLPAYWVAGLPPHFALGNNKFSSMFGTLFSTGRYFRHKLIDTRIAILTALCALGGSALGTRAVLWLDPHFLNWVLVVVIPIITVFTLLNKRLGHQNDSHLTPVHHRVSISILAGLFIGFWDGFFGPGTGTFLILIYTAMLKYDYVTANANTKVVNLASNIAALTVFLLHGRVFLPLALPAMVCGVAGNLVGSSLVLKRGARVIRPLFIGVLALLFAKILWDLILGQP